MLTYDDLIDQFLITSGQYILEDFIKDEGLSKNNILSIIKSEISTYSRFKPNIVTKPIYLYDGLVFDPKIEEVPEIISTITYREKYRGKSLRNFVPANSFSYNNGVFKTVLQKDVYNVTYSVQHKWDYDKNCCESLNFNSVEFINLFTGKLLISVGRARRSFTITDFPVDLDGDSLISEGKEIYDAAIASLQDRSYYSLIPKR